MHDDKDLIDRCLQNSPTAQKELYERFAARMYGISLRYAGQTLEADDILQEGFIRVFQKLNQFRFTGTLEGWLRKIFINTAITLAKREMKFSRREEFSTNNQPPGVDLDGLSKLSQKEILGLIQGLPVGYRTVFNLYVIEGYTHAEIGQMLKISENTSKSQLYAAKRSLRMKLTELGNDNGKEHR